MAGTAVGALPDISGVWGVGGGLVQVGFLVGGCRLGSV
jgi:hypothetical protein